MAGVSASQYRRFERGKVIPKFDQLLRLSNVFSVSVLYFAMDAPAPYAVETLGQRFAAGHTTWR
jgi:transcriptional regulator with XRE-family HTH domain